MGRTIIQLARKYKIDEEELIRAVQRLKITADRNKPLTDREQRELIAEVRPEQEGQPSVGHGGSPSTPSDPGKPRPLPLIVADDVAASRPTPSSSGYAIHLHEELFDEYESIPPPAWRLRFSHVL